MRSLPNKKVLRSLFDYDSATGVLRWRARGVKKWDSRYAENVDHADGDGFNNTWANLRAATISQNQMNRKVVCGGNRFRGVYQKGNRFVAQIKKDQKHVYIGMFAAQEEAAKAYDLEAVKLHGEFAVTNEQLGLL